MRAIRRRLPWLGLNLLTTSLSASVIGLFQGTIQSMALAAALMTIVAAQGGNAGVQTLTVMVRGMALGKISLAQARSILLKELAVGCGNGVALGIAAGVVTYVLHRQALLATVLGIALAVNFLVAALVGSLIPLVLRWLRADPAVASSVFVTACTDMCGFLVVPRPAVAGLAAVCVRRARFGLGTRNVRIRALPSPDPEPDPDQASAPAARRRACHRCRRSCASERARTAP